MAEKKQKQSDDQVFARFVGGEATFIGGIPARDLTKDEWDALPMELQKAALTTQIYEIPSNEI